MLKRLMIQNWRAFDAAEVALRPGLNILLGPNAVGKTSLLEAIAFALAGKPSTLPDVRQMVRADGAVDVTLTLELDGANWEVCRGLGPSHRRGAETLRRNGSSAAEGGEQVAAKLERLLGVPGEFFLRIAYMPEGDVYRFLSDSPLAALDAHLRRVLGLERLALIERTVARVKREINDERDTLGRLAEPVAERTRLLAEGRRRWTGDPAEQSRALESEQRRLAAESDEAGRQRRALQDALHRVEGLNSGLAQVEREQAELLAGGEPAPELQTLRARCVELDAALKERAGQISAAESEQNRLSERRRLLAARSATDLALDDPQLGATAAERTAAIADLDKALATLAAERNQAVRRGRELQARDPADLVADDPALRARRGGREARLRDLDAEQTAAATERKSSAESTQFLEAHAPGGTADPVCPVCRQPLPEMLRQRLLAENAARDRSLALQIAALQRRREELVLEGRSEAEALKRRLVEENVALVATLAEREATLRSQRGEQDEALRAEVEAARQRLLAEHDRQARELADQLAKLRAERRDTQATLDAAERQEGAARDRRRRLEDLAKQRRELLAGGATPESLRDEAARLRAQVAAALEREDALARAAKAAGAELGALQGYLELARIGSHPEEVLAAKRAALARRELLAELFATALTETQRQLREGALRDVYAEVERAWADFSGWSGARVQSLPKGRLAVHRDGRGLDLAQLSGGERAAFLALLHAHLGRHFGRGGFLVLDEPLEHLDAENGRRLLGHLVRACADGLLTQVVIATVEADVVNNAIGAGDATIIRLPLRPTAPAARAAR